MSPLTGHWETESDMTPDNNSDLGTLLETLRETAVKPFNQASPLPGVLHHSTAFHDYEQKKVFMQEWICLGRQDEISQPGSYLTHDIAGVPVFVIRQDNGNIGAFVNVCAHRHACLLSDEKGCIRKLTCRYHAWTYDGYGKLVAAPHMEMKPHFEKSNHNLRALKVSIWEGFIYISLSDRPSTNPTQNLQPFSRDIVGKYDMQCYQTVLRKKMRWNANWKNLIENFTESYHVPVAHKKTFALHEKPIGEYVCGEDSDYYGYHRAIQKADSGPGAAHPKNTRLEGEWRRMMVDFCIFPSHLVTLMPDYLWWISVQPRGVSSFEATWGVAIPPEVLEDIPDQDYDTWLTDIQEYMDIANDEDKVLVEALHNGTRSSLLPGGTYHPIERNLWQFNRYLARICGTT